MTMVMIILGSEAKNRSLLDSENPRQQQGPLETKAEEHRYNFLMSLLLLLTLLLVGWGRLEAQGLGFGGVWKLGVCPKLPERTKTRRLDVDAQACQAGGACAIVLGFRV